MAHIETLYKCRCGELYRKQKEAIACAVSHVRSVQFAVGKGGKMMPIYENHAPNSMNGVFGALREADLSDFIEERKLQLAEAEAKERHREQE